MKPYGCTLTRVGKAVIANVLAAKLPLTITRIMMGSGVCPDDVHPRDLEGVIDPVAEGTSTVPWCSGGTVHMMLEFRSDLNGGLKQDVIINEFGVYVKDLDGNSVLLYYGTLGDSPQKVSAFNGYGIDIRRFPINIEVGDEAEVVIDYSPEALMTAKDVEEYCTVTLLPMLIDEVVKALGGKPGGYIEMMESIPVERRFDDTLYGLILRDYG